MTKRILLVLVVMAPIFLSGCVLNTIMSDIVNKAPTAVVDADPREGAAPLTVHVNAGYSHDDDGSIVDYRWDFGDPTDTRIEAAANCEHTFVHPGTYLVKLTVIDDEGSVDSQQLAVIVTNAPPVAVASVNNENPLPGVRVIFNADASYDAQGAIASYAWDFGDGGSGVGSVVEHTYIQGGYYVATLTVTDAQGSTGQTHIGINVQPGQSRCGDDSSSCGGEEKPYAVITSNWSCSGATVGDPVRFDGTASFGGVGRIISYHWDFGDGSTASGGVVTHAYGAQNTYTVTLTVVDEAGGVGKATGNVQVNRSCN